MRTLNLKNTDLKVSNIAMGTDSLGSLINRNNSFELLDCYTELGGNLIDTAEGYANWICGGEHASENLIGEWMTERKNRHSTIISTKGAYYRAGEKHRLTEREIFSDLEGSLKRLGTDYIDIYWLHRDAADVLPGQMAEILTKAVKEGKVRYIGMSNWTHKRIDEANRFAEENDLEKIIASQIQYSPAKPNISNNDPDLVLINDGEYEYFKNNDLTVFAYAAQAKGFFSKYQSGGKSALSPKAEVRYYNEETLRRFERLNKISKEHGCTIGAAVLAALINNYDFDTVPIVGCKNIEQLNDSLSGSDIVFTKEEMDFIFER